MAKCKETAGFLIAAPCNSAADDRCKKCSKPICTRHSRQSSDGNGALCISCYREASTAYGSANDDPYLYSGSNYPNYYIYAAGAVAAAAGAAAVTHGLSQAQNAFSNSGDTEDWTDEAWENDYDGS